MKKSGSEITFFRVMTRWCSVRACLMRSAKRRCTKISLDNVNARRDVDTLTIKLAFHDLKLKAIIVTHQIISEIGRYILRTLSTI